MLGGLAAEVCQATGDGEAATGDGRVDEHAVAENVQEVGHAARCRARREASVRDGAPRSTRATTRATSRTWPGTGNEAEPQTCVPPVSMAARRSSQSSVPAPTSPHPCISGSPPRFTTYLIPGARPPVSAHESGSLGFALRKGEPFRMGFASLGGTRPGRRMTGEHLSSLSASPRRIGALGDLNDRQRRAGSSITEPVVHSNGSLGRGLRLHPVEDRHLTHGNGGTVGRSPSFLLRRAGRVWEPQPRPPGSSLYIFRPA